MNFISLSSILRNTKGIILLLAVILGLGSASSQTVDWIQKANPAYLSINGVAFRADGQKVISGTDCHPAYIRMFDVTSSNLDWDFTVGSSYMCIMGVTFSSNSNYIAAIEEFGNIFIFDNTGASPVIVDTINTGTSYGFSTAISPANDKVAVGCSNGKMKIYNLPGGTLANDINAPPTWVTAVTYSPDGNFIVTGGSDNKVKIWNASGTLLFTCNGHTGDITNVKVTPDNSFVVSSSKDKSIKVWNITTGALVRTITGHTDEVNGVDIFPDGSKIVSASADSTCKIWDLNTGSLINTFGVPDSGAVRTVAWSPTGNKIATGTAQSDVILWSVAGASGISNLNQFSFQVFPNPVGSFIQLSIPNELTVKQTEIRDVTGSVVFQSSQPQNQIPVSQLSAGTYFLTLLTTDNLSTTQLFIKQ